MYFHCPPVTSFYLGPNIFLSALFSNTLGLYFPPKMRDQVSYPYKTTGKIIVLLFYYLRFPIPDGKIKDSALHNNMHSPNLIYSSFLREWILDVSDTVIAG